MKLILVLALAGTLCGTSFAQQANVNLDYNPQKNTENLIPFGASLVSPEVRGDPDSETTLSKFLNAPGVNGKIDYLFVGQGTLEANARMGERCIALHQALTNHKIKHEYYVGGSGAHDWSTWRHLLYYRFLPGLWRVR